MNRPLRISVGVSLLAGVGLATFFGLAHPPEPRYTAPHNARTRAGGYDPDEAETRRLEVGRLLDEGLLATLDVDRLGNVRAEVSPSFAGLDLPSRRKVGALLYLWGRDQGAEETTVLFVSKGAEVGSYGAGGFVWR